MIRKFLVALAATTMLVQPVLAQSGAVPATQPASFAALVSQVQVPYEQFALPNGLRVIVHTDRKAPIVAVSVWYHIGSKDEPRGKTGFAHLFEHLMFYGSENNDGVFFKKLEDVGATDANGTTWFDRTNYFENVPTQALDLALYLESDRMGWLLGAVTQAKLDALGFKGVMRPVSTSCADHMGSAWARVHTWDGSKFVWASDWLQADEQIIKPLVKASADKYAAEKKLTRRAASDCQS